MSEAANDNQPPNFGEDGIVRIHQQEYAQLMAQASILRTVVHALGGKYEITIDALQKHGSGPMHLAGNPGRNVITIELDDPEMQAKLKAGREAAMAAATRHKTTSDKVASSAAKILNNPKSTKAERAVAASALTQKAKL